MGIVFHSTKVPLKVIFVKLLHSQNANSRIEVTELGMVTLVKLVHSKNAESPIEVTELGIVILVKLLH